MKDCCTKLLRRWSDAEIIFKCHKCGFTIDYGRVIFLDELVKTYRGSHFSKYRRSTGKVEDV